MVASSNNTLTLSYRDSHSSSSPPSHYPYAQEESPLPSYFGTPFNFTDPLLFVIIINLGSSLFCHIAIKIALCSLYLGPWPLPVMLWFFTGGCEDLHFPVHGY